MKSKKYYAMLLAVAMSAGTLASGEAVSADEITNIVFATPIVATVDMDRIEAKLNEITEPAIGVHVDIEGISLANYSNQVAMMQSGGEQVDVMGYFGNYSSLLANNQLMNISPYMEEHGQGIVEIVGENFLKSTSKQGNVYAVPTYNGKAAVMNLVIRKDLAEELELPLEQLTLAATFDEYCANLDLITEMFAKIKETHPEYMCVVPNSTSPNSLLIHTNGYMTDMLNDSYGVLMADDDYTNVVNYYESEQFRKYCEYAYAWNQAGYVLEDATTTQEVPNTYLQNGRIAAYFIVGEEGQAEQITTATGIEVESVKFSDAFIATNSVNGLGFAVSATSKEPEAAVKFLNMMYTNADVINLLDWGIEGEDWVLNEDGTVGFPEGVDGNNSQYNLNMDWYFGNQFLSYIWGEGRDTSIYERLEANNKNAVCTPAMGFSYDSTVVSNELAALSNVLNEYLPGLSLGAVDPATGIDKMNEALYAAGLQNVIDEKQAQLDAWRAENQ